MTKKFFKKLINFRPLIPSPYNSEYSQTYYTLNGKTWWFTPNKCTKITDHFYSYKEKRFVNELSAWKFIKNHKDWVIEVDIRHRCYYRDLDDFFNNVPCRAEDYNDTCPCQTIEKTLYKAIDTVYGYVEKYWTERRGIFHLREIDKLYADRVVEFLENQKITTYLEAGNVGKWIRIV